MWRRRHGPALETAHNPESRQPLLDQLRHSITSSARASSIGGTSSVGQATRHQFLHLAKAAAALSSFITLRMGANLCVARGAGRTRTFYRASAGLHHFTGDFLSLSCFTKKSVPSLKSSRGAPDQCAVLHVAVAGSTANAALFYWLAIGTHAVTICRWPEWTHSIRQR
jgi:hypothetical protein